MSEQMLLAAIKTMELKSMDNDALEALKQSLDHIIDNDVFPGEIQQEAFCCVTRIMDAQGERSAAATAAAKERTEKAKTAKALKDALNQHKNDTEAPGTTENDELIRMMIRAEEDGTLSFEFRGIRWDWNHMNGEWDYNKPK